ACCRGSTSHGRRRGRCSTESCARTSTAFSRRRPYATGGTPTEKLWYTTSHYADGSTRSKAMPGREFSGIVAGLAILADETAKRQSTKETIPMKLTWLGHSTFRIEAGAAKILIDPFLSDNPSWDNGWSGYLTGKNSTQGGDR